MNERMTRSSSCSSACSPHRRHPRAASPAPTPTACPAPVPADARCYTGADGARRLLLDRDPEGLEPGAGDARARRPRDRPAEARAQREGPGALGRHREGRLRLGRLDLPARRLRRDDGGRGHRAPAPASSCSTSARRAARCCTARATAARVASKAAELYAQVDGKPSPYDGVLLTNGVLGGGNSAYEFRLDLRVVYQYVCRNHPRPDEPQYPLWMGLPKDSKLTRAELAERVKACTGVGLPAAQRTPEQAARLKTILSVVKIPERTLLGHLNWATWLFQDLVQERLGGRNPFGNIGVVYQGSADDAALNAGVLRYAADPQAQGALATDSRPTGRTTLPTLHAARDRRPDRLRRARERLPRDPRRRRHRRPPGAELQRRVRAQLPERARVPGAVRRAASTGSTRATSPRRLRWPRAAPASSRPSTTAARTAAASGPTTAARRSRAACRCARTCPAAGCSNPPRRSACGRRRPS